MKNKNSPLAPATAVKDNRAVDLDPALVGNRQFELMFQRRRISFQTIHQPGQFMRTKSLHNCPRADVRREAKETAESAVSQLNAATLIQQEQTFCHAIENGVLLGL